MYNSLCAGELAELAEQDLGVLELLTGTGVKGLCLDGDAFEIVAREGRRWTSRST